VIKPPPPPRAPPPFAPPPPPIIAVIDLSYDEYEEVEVKVEADKVPPVLTMLGDAVQEMFQLEPWVDPGVEAKDVRDGTWVIYGSPSFIDTATCTPPDRPFVITYRARDAASNEAISVSREVHITSPCLEPSFLCVDLEPPACATCLDDGMCSCFTSAESILAAEVVVDEYVPPQDHDAPVITLLGDGQLAMLESDSSIIIIDTVLLGDPFIHAGVTAYVSSFSTHPYRTIASPEAFVTLTGTEVGCVAQVRCDGRRPHRHGDG
jgi:hypothetical protein